jgi:hypothetical protein
MSDEAVRRDDSWIQREYGAEKWPRVERLIEDTLAEEPDAGLARALRAVARENWDAASPFVMGETVFDGSLVKTPRSAAFGASQGMICDVLHHACVPETGLVVELGAGWAWHLLTFWLSTGPRNATYVAAEYTDAGRRAGTRLAGLDQRLAFQAIPFDYHNPSLAGLGDAEHAVVFSHHSIEQIPRITPAAIDAMRGVAPRVTGVHFEPVGWQVHGGERTGTSAEYADRHDYNRNLVEVLQGEAAAGRITIDHMADEIIGVAPYNATTIIVWHAG